jgi:PhnB protein
MKIEEVFPYVCVKNAAKAIEFYKEAFGATEKFRLTEPNGRIGHAEINLGTACCIMLSDEFPEYGIVAPKASEPSSFQIHIHVDDADDFIARARKLGAEVVREAKDQFYGERSGTIRDPFGLQWNIGHHIEDVSPEQMQERYDEMTKNHSL